MQKGIFFIFALVLLASFSPTVASAQTYYYYVPTITQPTYPSTTYKGSAQMNEAELAIYLRQLISQLQNQISTSRTYTYSTNYSKPTYYDYNSSNNYNRGGENYIVGAPRGYNDNYRDYNNDYYYRNNNYNNYSNYDDEPEAITNSAFNINRNDARLRGEVRMNDFDYGTAFFVYGTDRNLVEDIENDFNDFNDIDERGDQLEKIRVDSNAYGTRTYEARVSGLTRDEQYYFSMCVSYEDDRNRDTITCGNTVRFTTDN